MEEQKTIGEKYEEARDKLQKELEEVKKKNEMKEEIGKIRSEINKEKKKNSWLFKLLSKGNKGDFE